MHDFSSPVHHSRHEGECLAMNTTVEISRHCLHSFAMTVGSFSNFPPTFFFFSASSPSSPSSSSFQCFLSVGVILLKTRYLFLPLNLIVPPEQHSTFSRLLNNSLFFNSFKQHRVLSRLWFFFLYLLHCSSKSKIFWSVISLDQHSSNCSLTKQDFSRPFTILHIDAFWIIINISECLLIPPVEGLNVLTT